MARLLTEEYIQDQGKVGARAITFAAPESFDMWLKTAEVAAPHTSRVDPSDVFKTRRPSEDPETLKYRRDNYRWYTKEGFDRFVDLTGQILSNISIDHKTFSKELIEYWSKDSYHAAGQSVGWKEYFFNYISRIMLSSPNSVEVNIPYRVENPDESPLSGAGNELLDIHHAIVSPERIRVLNRDLFIFEADSYVTLYSKNVGYKYSWYWVCDRENWYRLLPRKEGKELVYDLEEWYRHDTGVEDNKELPIQKLPGIITQAPYSNSFYHESYINSYFEIANEYINRVSDEQAVSMKSSYSVRIYKKLDCPRCDGSGVQRLNEGDGLSLKKSKKVCPECNGQGRLSIISPFQDIVFSDKVTDDRQQPTKASDIITSYSPDISVAQYNFDTSEALAMKMFNSIGLNLISNSNESGEAKRLLLQKQEHIVNSIKDGLFAFIERHCLYLESILNPDRSRRSRPKLNVSEQIRIKDNNILNEELANAPPSLKYSKTKELIQFKFKGHEIEMRRELLKLKWAPSLIYTIQEIEGLVAGGLLSAQEFNRYRFASVIFEDIEIEDRSEKDIFTDAQDALNLMTGGDQQIDFDDAIDETIIEPETPEE